MQDLDRRDLLRRAALCAATVTLGASPSGAMAPDPEQRWTVERATAWNAEQPWRAGCNYIPASAVNVLEMWQGPSFDPEGIARELGWAAGIGVNAVRVFLHDLVWQQDTDGFLSRVDQFLALAAQRRIATLFVLFDSCWDPFPHLGPQPAPRPGIHNSRWVQSPGAVALADRSQWPRLHAYVTQVLSRFGRDGRVLGWDLWNEPDNVNVGSYSTQESPDKLALVAQLLPQVYAWARSTSPSQPLTSGLWQGRWARVDEVTPIQRTQLTQSDVLSFHNYGSATDFAARLASLQVYGRPLLCTEYMARPLGSTIEAILPIARQAGVAAFNWGLVSGKTQTTLPWDSWQHPYEAHQPDTWFHDLFRADGHPYSQEEATVFRRETASDRPSHPAPVPPG